MTTKKQVNVDVEKNNTSNQQDVCEYCGSTPEQSKVWGCDFCCDHK